MIQAIDINIFESMWYKVAKFVLYTVGLSLVIIAVFTVTNNKLNKLKTVDNAWQNKYTTAEVRTRELDCLTRNIYWEAAQEPFEGKVGVAQVTINRVESGKFADSICGVVYQKNVFYEKVVCQFSWFCENTHRTRAIHKPLWDESAEVAKKVLLEGFRLPGLKSALFYHADYVSPNWGKPRIEKIGRHILYGERV